MLDSIMNMHWILNIPICEGYKWFWIKFSIIDICQGSKYALSFEYASVTQGSFCPYSTRSQYARAWIYKVCEYIKITQGSV